MQKTPHAVVIGAGIGGLTTAAVLLKNGYQVTVLEAHVYPGGSAGTFYHKGYRFDAGATLAGGFSPGGPHARLADLLGLNWPVRPVDPAWVTHLPGLSVTQWSSSERWEAEWRNAFPQSEKFWRAQEKIAGIAWDLSSRSFPWPPEGFSDLLTLAAAVRPRSLGAAPHLFQTVASLAPRGLPEDFYTFLDAQLLISAQTTARHASALYGSAALDLPRRGVNMVRGGIGALAQTLVAWIRANGGTIHYRQAVEQILLDPAGSRVTGVRTNRAQEFPCDVIAANLTPWSLAHLLGSAAPRSLLHETSRRPPSWGAFILYLGLENSKLPAGIPDHHQVIVDPRKPMGEGNSVFLSLSEQTDPTRAPKGMRAATISTHTAVAPWWEAARKDPALYIARKAEYTDRVLSAVQRALPGIRSAIRLQMSGTPLTFAYYTRRAQGMVGGFPQTSIFKARGPGTGIQGLWLVGDSVFPGQSTAGTTLGGWRVADAILRSTRKT